MVTNNWTPEKIKELRLKLKQSQQEFATMLCIGMGTVSRWERGTQKPERKAILEKLEGLDARD